VQHYWRLRLHVSPDDSELATAMTEAGPSLDWLAAAADVCAQELGVRPNWAVNAELLPEEGVPARVQPVLATPS
jgi:hypothetical protein